MIGGCALEFHHLPVCDSQPATITWHGNLAHFRLAHRGILWEGMSNVKIRGLLCPRSEGRQSSFWATRISVSMAVKPQVAPRRMADEHIGHNDYEELLAQQLGRGPWAVMAQIGTDDQAGTALATRVSAHTPGTRRPQPGQCPSPNTSSAILKPSRRIRSVLQWGQ